LLDSLLQESHHAGSTGQGNVAQDVS